jgi:hypothetical protein
MAGRARNGPKMSDKTTHYSPVFYKEFWALKNGFWYDDV